MVFDDVASGNCQRPTMLDPNKASTTNTIKQNILDPCLNNLLDYVEWCWISLTGSNFSSKASVANIFGPTKRFCDKPVLSVQRYIEYRPNKTVHVVLSISTKNQN